MQDSEAVLKFNDGSESNDKMSISAQRYVYFFFKVCGYLDCLKQIKTDLHVEHHARYDELRFTAMNILFGLGTMAVCSRWCITTRIYEVPPQIMRWMRRAWLMKVSDEMRQMFRDCPFLLVDYFLPQNRHSNAIYR